MNRIYVSIEGQTEETFIRELLRRHLWEHNVDLQPVIITTRRVKQGKNFKGGVLSYGKARNEVIRLLNDSQAVAVTTMYDLYHLPKDFPGQDTRPTGDGKAKALHLEKAFQNDIGSRHFHPYLQVHEFEAFLFVNPTRTANMFAEVENLEKQLQTIRKKFPTPEDINDNPNTAPSKRILSLYPRYEKPLYGTLVTLEVGLDSIRTECPHFNEWVTWLESLG
ncbi:MAG: DUF4276 family protein [Thioploca sp.]|nr:DUF4276 family protein [Thioploca sp.]